MIRNVTMFQLVCDGCGRADTGEYYAWADREQCREAVTDEGWFHFAPVSTWDLCPDCWAWDDDDNRVYVNAAAEKAARGALPPLEGVE